MFVHRLPISLFISILMSADLGQTWSRRHNGVEEEASGVEENQLSLAERWTRGQHGTGHWTRPLGLSDRVTDCS